MAGPGARDFPLVHGAAHTGAGDTGWGGDLSGVTNGGTIVTLRESAVWGSLGTLGKGADKPGYSITGGAGSGAMGAGAVGGMVVTLDKMRESAWMAEN